MQFFFCKNFMDQILGLCCISFGFVLLDDTFLISVVTFVYLFFLFLLCSIFFRTCVSRRQCNIAWNIGIPANLLMHVRYQKFISFLTGWHKSLTENCRGNCSGENSEVLKVGQFKTLNLHWKLLHMFICKERDSLSSFTFSIEGVSFRIQLWNGRLYLKVICKFSFYICLLDFVCYPK